MLPHRRVISVGPQEEAQLAMEQLAALSRPDPPRFPLGQLNPKPLKAARVRRLTEACPENLCAARSAPGCFAAAGAVMRGRR